ncbi:MAG: tetratricopeptide repeat protein [Ferruginibacter sp.]
MINKKTVVKSLEEYIKALNLTYTELDDSKKIAFRGQADQAWDINCGVVRRLHSAKLLRKYSDASVSREEIISYIEEKIEEIRKRAGTYPAIKNIGDVSLMAEMQHFGGATLLIDFTFNALVALFMAASEWFNKNGCVYCIDYQKKTEFDVIDEFKELKNEDQGIKSVLANAKGRNIIYKPDHTNVRIIKQESIFLMNEKGVIDKSDIDHTIVIDHQYKKNILAELEQVAGVNEETIYPDFWGYLQANSSGKPYVYKSAQEYYRMAFDYEKISSTSGDQLYLEKAIDYYNKALRINHKYTEALINLGLIYYEREKNYEEALRLFTAATKIKPKDADTWYNRGTCYLDNKEYDKAIADFKRALNIDRADLSSLNNLAFTYQNKKMYTEAIATYKKALKIDNEDADLWFGLGEVYQEKQNYAKAVYYYDIAIQLDHKDGEAHFNKAFCFYRQGNQRGAQKILLSLLKKKNQNAGILNLLGISYFKSGDYALAKKYFLSALDIDKDFAEAWNNMGFLAIRTNSLEEAERHLRKSVELGSLDFGNKSLGHLALCTKETDKAIGYYKIALQSIEFKNFMDNFKEDYEDLNLKQFGVEKTEIVKLMKLLK